MNLHKHQLYLLEQHSESFKSWSAIIRINTECKSLIMKFGLDLISKCSILIYYNNLQLKDVHLLYNCCEMVGPNVRHCDVNYVPFLCQDV